MNYHITIQGRGGHGSRPDLAYNPVDCFAAIFGALQSFAPNFTQVESGTAANVIPDKLTFEMECSRGQEEISALLAPICQLYHCSFNFK